MKCHHREYQPGSDLRIRVRRVATAYCAILRSKNGGDGFPSTAEVSEKAGLPTSSVRALCNEWELPLADGALRGSTAAREVVGVKEARRRCIALFGTYTGVL